MREEVVVTPTCRLVVVVVHIVWMIVIIIIGPQKLCQPRNRFHQSVIRGIQRMYPADPPMKRQGGEEEKPVQSFGSEHVEMRQRC